MKREGVGTLARRRRTCGEKVSSLQAVMPTSVGVERTPHAGRREEVASHGKSPEVGTDR